MQHVIIQQNGNISVSEMLRLYSLFSDDNPSACETFRPCMKPLVDELRIGCEKQVHYKDPVLQQGLFDDRKSQDSNCAVVCFSGGKDSVATAMRCREMGYDVKLYHVHGINHSYPDEMDRAKEIAGYLGLPLHVENVRLKGTTSFLENPMKNQLIGAMALCWSDKNRFGSRIATGNFPTEHIDERTDFRINWCDTIEMWTAFEKYILHDYEDFELLLPFDNHLQTLEYVANDRRLLEMMQGCLAPFRYREFWRSKNVKKYGEEAILPHRCGSCWKCCFEYMHLVDLNILPMNEEYYEKCKSILKKKAKEI